MKLFITRKEKIRRFLRIILPVLCLAAVIVVFSVAVSRSMEGSLESQQNTLKTALENGAIRSYSLTGAYPESLEELLAFCHVSYDKAKFIVEYTPTASNLFPSVFVIPIRSKT